MSRALRRRALRATGLLVAIALASDRRGPFAFTSPSVPSSGGDAAAAVTEAPARETPRAPVDAARPKRKLPFYEQPYYLKLMMGSKDFRLGTKRLFAALNDGNHQDDIFAESSQPGDWYLMGMMTRGGFNRAQKTLTLAGSKQKVLAVLKDFLDDLTQSDCDRRFEDRVTFVVPTPTGLRFQSQWYEEDSKPKEGILVLTKDFAPAYESRLKVIGDKEQFLVVAEALLDEIGNDVELARELSNPRQLPRYTSHDAEIRIPLVDKQGLAVIGKGGKFLKMLFDEFPVGIKVADDLSYVNLKGRMGDVWGAQARIVDMLAQRKANPEFVDGVRAVPSAS